MQLSIWDTGGSESGKALDEVAAWFGQQSDLAARLGAAMARAVDIVMGSFAPGAFSLDALSKTEKTLFGTTVENEIRSELGLPHGSLRDLRVAGHEVDCKFSLKMWGWMIPPESEGELCLLLTCEPSTRHVFAGLTQVCRGDITEPNRDGKGSIRASARNKIRVLANAAAMPRQEGASSLAILVARTLISSNGGRVRPDEIRGLLQSAGYCLLDGSDPKDLLVAEREGVRDLLPDEWLCLRTPEMDRDGQDRSCRQTPEHATDSVP